MPDYNPNSVWGSKEKKYTYTPPGDRTSYTAQRPQDAQNPPPGGTPPPGEKSGNKPPAQPSFFKRHSLLFGTIGIFLAIGLAAFIYYLLLPPSTPNIAITFSDPGTIVLGEPFPLTITVSNQSKSALRNTQLTLTLPAGISFVATGTTPGQRALMIPIGTLSSQTINPPQTIELIATGNPGTSQTANAVLTYSTAASPDTQFTNTANTSLAVGTQAALTVSYTVPSNIFSGQNFDIAMNYQNNTGENMPGVDLQLQYPPAYTFISVSGTAPAETIWDLGTLKTKTWSLGDLPANATGTIIVTGNIVGPAGAQYQLTGVIGANFGGQNYPANIAPVNFAVTPSPLSFTIALNNSSTYIAGLGDNLDYVLTYTNDSNVTFQAMNISATLVGQMYDFKSLKTNGSFNSQSNTITWNTANAPALAAIPPGQSGSVDFTINTKSSFPIKLPSDKDYSLNVFAKAQSPTVPPNTAGANTVSVASLTSKVGGEIALTSDAFYKETAVGIKNTGPYPPKVDQPTTYTIHWSLVNYSTDMQNVTISAYLQSGTTFTGVATSTGLTSTTLPVYNAGTGEVTWTIPYVPATAGVISAPVMAVFQVTNTPAVNQVGQQVTLMGPATLTATDAYTGAAISQSTNAIITQLPDDPFVKNQNGDVTQ